ncbi:MAG: hypothetical protein ACR2JB_27035 [Bryobacteraceae bacterium]
MDRALLERVISAVESHLKSRCSPLEFEMAYQTRAAIDQIRFAIKQTEQFANCSPQAREAAFQVLDAWIVLKQLIDVSRAVPVCTTYLPTPMGWDRSRGDVKWPTRNRLNKRT